MLGLAKSFEFRFRNTFVASYFPVKKSVTERFIGGCRRFMSRFLVDFAEVGGYVARRSRRSMCAAILSRLFAMTPSPTQRCTPSEP